MHSINDIFKSTINDDFFKSDEFIALKTIRNLYHHQAYVKNEFRIIPLEEISFVVTDLHYLCLIKLSSVKEAIDNTPKKYKEDVVEKITSVFHFYDNVVNINPCIFNFIVQIYEKMFKYNIILDTEDYNKFKDSYDYETTNGYSHFINGKIKIVCHPNDVSKFRNILFSEII